MKKYWPLLLLIPAFIIGRQLFSAGKLLFRVIGLNFRGGQFFITVELFNPTNTSIKVDSFIANLKLGSDAFGIVDLRIPGGKFIEAQNRTNLDIPIKLDPLNAAKLTLQYATNKNAFAGRKLTVEGTIRTANVTIPVKTELTTV